MSDLNEVEWLWVAWLLEGLEQTSSRNVDTLKSRLKTVARESEISRNIASRSDMGLFHELDRLDQGDVVVWEELVLDATWSTMEPIVSDTDSEVKSHQHCD